MTIEIADRLVQLRKKHGLSQEELADKLGLSRQAVSKWERAEASPDTDNLICLAKLYGVSLDELLSTDDDVETIVKEQVKSKEEKTENAESVVLTDKDGSRVVIKDKHVQCYDKNGNKVDREKYKDKFTRTLDAIDACLTCLMVVVYVCLGVSYLSYSNEPNSLLMVSRFTSEASTWPIIWLSILKVLAMAIISLAAFSLV